MAIILRWIEILLVSCKIISTLTQDLKVSIPSLNNQEDERISIYDLEIYNVNKSSLPRPESTSSPTDSNKSIIKLKQPQRQYSNVDFDVNSPRIFRISMIINEPYKREYENELEDEFEKFTAELVKTIESILSLKLNKFHSAYFLSMEDVPDPFESLVHLDIQTMSSEAEVREVLQDHLNVYYAFGKFIVNPRTLFLRPVQSCQFREFACDATRCIPLSQKCDFKLDCQDGTDEYNCNYTTPIFEPQDICNGNETICPDNSKCIENDLFCDGNFDCSDGSDEKHCGPNNCKPSEFRCHNNRCVFLIDRCDGDDDCFDKSDEIDCKSPRENLPCSYGEFKCFGDKKCLSKSLHCDGEKDCEDGSDEVGCSTPFITQSPPSLKFLNSGKNLTIVCRSTGTPAPVVFWRFNWGNVPATCTMTSKNGLGILFCPNVNRTSQGVYTCESVNSLGFATPPSDTILVIGEFEKCPSGKSEGRVAKKCRICSYFGQDETALKKLDLVDAFSVAKWNETFEARMIRLESSWSENETSNNNGVHFVGFDESSKGSGSVFFVNLIWNISVKNKSELFDGYMEFEIFCKVSATPLEVPFIVLSDGRGSKIFHRDFKVLMDQYNRRVVKFLPEEWLKRNNESLVTTTYEELKEMLENLQEILIRVQHDNSSFINAYLSDIVIVTGKKHVYAINLCEQPYQTECHFSQGYIRTTCACCKKSSYNDSFDDSDHHFQNSSFRTSERHHCLSNNDVLDISNITNHCPTCSAKQCYDIYKTIRNETVVSRSNTSVAFFGDCTKGIDDNSVDFPTSTLESLETTEFDVCTSTRPCNSNGICLLADNSTTNYTCNCYYGYTGKNCENAIKKCELWRPCKNGGTCTNFFSNNFRSYRCSCQFPYTGSNCEKRVELYNDAMFNGDSWLQLNTSLFMPEIGQGSSSKELLALEISTNSSNGLIFWCKYENPESNGNQVLYTILAVVDSHIEFQYDSPDSPRLFRERKVKVSDGKRHVIIFSKQGRQATLTIDEAKIDIDTRSYRSRLSYEPVAGFIGGVPNYLFGQNKHNGFQGCVHNFEVLDSGTLPIGKVAIRGRNLYPCTRERWKPSSLILIEDDGGESTIRVPTISSTTSKCSTRFLSQVSWVVSLIVHFL